MDSGINEFGLAKGDLSRLTGTALKAFFRVAAIWALTEPEQMALLGIKGRRTLLRWQRREVRAVSRESMLRISCVFGIFKALGILFQRSELADLWIRSPNTAPLFGGRSALELMTSGNFADLLAVRRYLDAETDGI